MLQVIFALRSRFKTHTSIRRGSAWALIAMDVAYDSNQNAHILDVNSGPSPSPLFFDKRKHPPWLIKDRDLLAREAIDIVQEVGFRKLVRSWGRMKNATQAKLSFTGGWQLLYHEERGGSLHPKLLQPGECVKGWGSN
mmetsp:Transcript_1029/g.1728  ORF Transcript_1029/g.1728 Transcript_1029/m.1728 type:complete len:138 (+) Transcript_1029:212-625(+)